MPVAGWEVDGFCVRGAAGLTHSIFAARASLPRSLGSGSGLHAMILEDGYRWVG